MRDIGIINTAGPTMAQAVAFRSESDKSVYYRCSFDGYQDTLYPHGNHQFYRECDITGTVDFIFGNAAAVFQYCNIRPREPLPGQAITITAQSRNETTQITGFSLHRCTISPNGNVTAPTYLGRPWRNVSTVAVMESKISSIVQGQGWLSWGNTSTSSVFYGEYKNTGLGSDLTQRITWDTYKPVMSDAQVKWFSVDTFLKGYEWLPATVVPYEST